MTPDQIERGAAVNLDFFLNLERSGIDPAALTSEDFGELIVVLPPADLQALGAYLLTLDVLSPATRANLINALQPGPTKEKDK